MKFHFIAILILLKLIKYLKDLSTQQDVEGNVSTRNNLLIMCNFFFFNLTLHPVSTNASHGKALTHTQFIFIYLFVLLNQI